MVSVLSRQAAGIMSSGRRPGRTEVLLWRVPADNGPGGWRPKDQWPNPTTTIKLRNWSLPRKVWPDHPLRPSDPFPMP